MTASRCIIAAFTVAVAVNGVAAQYGCIVSLPAPYNDVSVNLTTVGVQRFDVGWYPSFPYAGDVTVMFSFCDAFVPPPASQCGSGAVSWVAWRGGAASDSGSSGSPCLQTSQMWPEMYLNTSTNKLYVAWLDVAENWTLTMPITANASRHTTQFQYLGNYNWDVPLIAPLFSYPLQRFFDLMSGSLFWKQTHGWYSGKISPCDYYGVTCVRMQRPWSVQRSMGLFVAYTINLPNNGLYGNLSEAQFLFHNTSTTLVFQFNVSGNNVYGRLPEVIALPPIYASSTVSVTTYFDVSNNAVNGTVPSTFLCRPQGLGAWPFTVSAANNQLEGSIDLLNCVEGDWLNYTGLPSAVADFTGNPKLFALVAPTWMTTGIQLDPTVSVYPISQPATTVPSTPTRYFKQQGLYRTFVRLTAGLITASTYHGNTIVAKCIYNASSTPFGGGTVRYEPSYGIPHDFGNIAAALWPCALPVSSTFDERIAPSSMAVPQMVFMRPGNNVTVVAYDAVSLTSKTVSFMFRA